MDDLQRAIRTYANDLAPLARADTSREETYYPPVRNLVASILKSLGLPIEVRTSTSERRTGGGIDLPDVAIYDGPGDFIVVAGEVKLPKLIFGYVQIQPNETIRSAAIWPVRASFCCVTFAALLF